MEPLILYLTQASSLLGMTPQRLYELTRNRAQARQTHPIPFFRIGRRVAFTRPALESWIVTLQQNGGSR
jgi:predicted DNA-binding transcriptional regulator AlpA